MDSISQAISDALGHDKKVKVYDEMELSDFIGAIGDDPNPSPEESPHSYFEKIFRLNGFSPLHKKIFGNILCNELLDLQGVAP